VKPPRVIESPYITSAEAVAYLRLKSLSNLYRLVREHRLPTLRRGNVYLFDKREIDAWVRGADSAISLVRDQRRVS